MSRQQRINDLLTHIFTDFYIKIIDNSHLHKSHKFFSPEKYHLHLKIKSLYLKSISKINAQRLIMKILKDDLKSKIHALEISIE